MDSLRYHRLPLLRGISMILKQALNALWFMPVDLTLSRELHILCLGLLLIPPVPDLAFLHLWLHFTFLYLSFGPCFWLHSTYGHLGKNSLSIFAPKPPPWPRSL